MGVLTGHYKCKEDSGPSIVGAVFLGVLGLLNTAMVGTQLYSYYKAWKNKPVYDDVDWATIKAVRIKGAIYGTLFQMFWMWFLYKHWKNCDLVIGVVKILVLPTIVLICTLLIWVVFVAALMGTVGSVAIAASNSHHHQQHTNSSTAMTTTTTQ